MSDAHYVERTWFINLIADELRIRGRYQRCRGLIQEYAVQLELYRGAQWTAIVRYDNAHGFSHRDTIHLDGSQDKVPIYRGDANGSFTWAITELRENWQAHRDRFLAEFES